MGYRGPRRAKARQGGNSGVSRNARSGVAAGHSPRIVRTAITTINRWITPAIEITAKYPAINLF